MALQMVMLTVYTFFCLVVFEVYTLSSPAEIAGLTLFHLDFVLHHND